MRRARLAFQLLNRVVRVHTYDGHPIHLHGFRNVNAWRSILGVRETLHTATLITGRWNDNTYTSRTMYEKMLRQYMEGPA